MNKKILHSPLTEDTITLLKQSLLFLHMQELRDLCTMLEIHNTGKKITLITRIFNFLTKGIILTELPIPLSSRAQKGKTYPLAPDTLILKNSYKNDLKTRLFFKQLIGEHFHFTAYGIDWINERWIKGNPPTYQEYATMWQQEYTYRQQHGSTPKEEWAYINFIQKYMTKNPHASRQESLSAWEQERQKYVKNVENIVGKKLYE